MAFRKVEVRDSTSELRVCPLRGFAPPVKDGVRTLHKDQKKVFRSMRGFASVSAFLYGLSFACLVTVPLGSCTD